MARQAARDDEDGIDPDDVARTGVACRQALGGGRDPTQAVVVERPGCGLRTAALLDLDERKRRAAPGDQIDFATRDPCPNR